MSYNGIMGGVVKRTGFSFFQMLGKPVAKRNLKNRDSLESTSRYAIFRASDVRVKTTQ
jgi:hypothetical protein